MPSLVNPIDAIRKCLDAEEVIRFTRNCFKTLILSLVIDDGSDSNVNSEDSCSIEVGGYFLAERFQQLR